MQTMMQEQGCPPAQKNILMASPREQFPVKLHSLLEMAHMGGIGCSGAVTWLPHGRAFKILDEHVFMEVVVPMFFKQTKIRSFYRQLNLWGYKRVYKGIDAGAWYNDHFLRGQPHEMKNMVRIKIKGKAKLDPMDDKNPDFYSMPLLACVTKQTVALSHAAINCAQNHVRRVSTKIFNGSNQSISELQLSGSNHSHNMSRGSEGFQQLNGSNHSINAFQLSGDPLFSNPRGHGLSMCKPPLTGRFSLPTLVTRSVTSMEQPLQRRNVWTNSGVPSTTRNHANHNNGFFHRRVSMQQQHQPSPMAVSSDIFSVDIGRLMGEIQPLPFDQVPSTSVFPQKSENNIINGSSLEPLPYYSDESEHGVLEDEVDGFSSYIGDVINVL